MPAKTKTELIALTEKEYAKLCEVIGRVDPQMAMRKDEDDTSLKDIIAHRAHWIDLFLGWYRDGQAGQDVFFPAEGYKWNDLKRYNADLRAQQVSVGWGEAKEMLAQNHAALLDLISTLSDIELFGTPMKGAKNTWTTGRWAEAAGPSHYRSASKVVRAVLRAGR